VRFKQHDLFPSALLKFNEADTIDVEVYQCWLQVRILNKQKIGRTGHPGLGMSHFLFVY
jgi:hypothetical protein